MKNEPINMITWTFSTVMLVVMVSSLLLYKNLVPSQEFEDSIINNKSISFILGEDKKGSNYYELASRYFALDSINKTDIVNTSCRTLDCVIETLNHNEVNRWEIVNIIAHGNPDTGLNIFLDHTGYKATPKRLLQECLLKNLPTLDGNKINSDTEFKIYSCGIGNNVMMNISLRKIFSPTVGIHPKVEGSKNYIIFVERPDNPCPAMVEANYYSYYFHRANRPSESEITEALTKKYGNQSIDWKAALNQERFDSTQTAFTAEYEIPIQYIKTFTDINSRPKLKSKQDQLKWIAKQSDITQQLKEINIPIEKFDWNIDYKMMNKDGQEIPIIEAKGVTTVLNVMKQV